MNRLFTSPHKEPQICSVGPSARHGRQEPSGEGGRCYPEPSMAPRQQSSHRSGASRKEGRSLISGSASPGVGGNLRVQKTTL